MIFGTCVWAGAAFGSNILDDLLGPGHPKHRVEQGLGPHTVPFVRMSKCFGMQNTSENVSVVMSNDPQGSYSGNSLDLYEINSYSQMLLPEMQKKWEELSWAAPPSRMFNLLLHTAALEPEDVKMLATQEYDVEEIVEEAAKRFAKGYQIPEALAKNFSIEMGRQSLHDALVSLVKNKYCLFQADEALLRDLDEEGLKDLLRNAFLRNDCLFAHGADYRKFLKTYLQERDFDKAVNTLLQGDEVEKETLARLSLPVKLQATCLIGKGIEVKEVLARILPMEEERALAVLSFLRVYPLAYTAFWEVEKELSLTYIVWVASRYVVKHESISPLLQLGELDEENRQELLGLPSFVLRQELVDKWLREKNTAA